MSCQLLRRHAVESLTGLRRSAIYQRIADGLLPRPINIGRRAVAWQASEIECINLARVAGADDGAIRALVTKLHADRAQLGEGA
jgi:prophage regulatory protein